MTCPVSWCRNGPNGRDMVKMCGECLRDEADRIMDAHQDRCLCSEGCSRVPGHPLNLRLDGRKIDRMADEHDRR